jgi:hypothetical protein
MRIRTDNTDAGSFWSRLGQIFGREVAPDLQGRRVQVWDAGREVYRWVDLADRNDPMWHAAQSIASASRERPRSAA